MKYYNPKERLVLESDTLENSRGATLMQKECLKALMNCGFLVNEWERISTRPLQNRVKSFTRSVRAKNSTVSWLPSFACGLNFWKHYFKLRMWNWLITMHMRLWLTQLGCPALFCQTLPKCKNCPTPFQTHSFHTVSVPQNLKWNMKCPTAFCPSA